MEYFKVLQSSLAVSTRLMPRALARAFNRQAVLLVLILFMNASSAVVASGFPDEAATQDCNNTAIGDCGTCSPPIDPCNSPWCLVQTTNCSRDDSIGVPEDLPDEVLTILERIDCTECPCLCPPTTPDDPRCENLSFSFDQGRRIEHTFYDNPIPCQTALEQQIENAFDPNNSPTVNPASQSFSLGLAICQEGFVHVTQTNERRQIVTEHTLYLQGIYIDNPHDPNQCSGCPTGQSQFTWQVECGSPGTSNSIETTYGNPDVMWARDACPNTPNCNQ
ncbi:MAG: hypothetical protein AAGI30_07515 [Planctomycetota bacterium]